jgi:hypothetical protein
MVFIAALVWPGDHGRSLPAARAIANQPSMSMRWKKFIGVFALIGIIAIYALLVMRAAIAILPEAGPVAEFLFYAVAGMAWVVPVRYLILWMNTPGRADRPTGEQAR